MFFALIFNFFVCELFFSMNYLGPFLSTRSRKERLHALRIWIGIWHFWTDCFPCEPHNWCQFESNGHENDTQRWNWNCGCNFNFVRFVGQNWKWENIPRIIFHSTNHRGKISYLFAILIDFSITENKTKNDF